MKRKLSAFSRRYEAGLRKHLKQGPRASLSPAHDLGSRAVILGLKTLDLARIHEQALTTFKAGSSRDGIIQRAELFFAEVSIPIENTHCSALKANARLTQQNKTLGRRTVNLMAVNRLLQRGVAQSKAAEIGLKKRARNRAGLLKESRRLQKHLRHLTHQILSMQEADRKKISRELHDEVAQTLLGINVRLLTLKKEATVGTESLEKEIASTQRLVVESVQSINRFARELDVRQQTSGAHSITAL